jgi:hypothetical protein
MGRLGVMPCDMRSVWLGRDGLRIEADGGSAMDSVDCHHNVPRCAVVDIVVLGRFGVVEDVVEEGPLTGRQPGGEGVQSLAKDNGLVLGELVGTHGVCTLCMHGTD